ncbi:MAG: oligosaccharide repeat unit polymerase [Bacteroidetes bacterium]|nr:oligosaccharide repeat unit polymerase [Bacteroidota bacterium]MCH8941347.1 oligosaccharide repeat unit polymerase [Bacteroidota bacterium]
MINAISIISFIICIGILISLVRPNSDLLSPGKLFSLVWFLVIGVTNLKLSMWQQNWPIEVWIQIMIGPIAFMVGIFFTYVINFDKKIWSNLSIKKNLDLLKLNYSRLFVVIIILFVLFVVSYFIITLKAGTIPILSTKPWLVRRNFTMFGIGLFLHNVFLIVLLSGVYIIFVKDKKLKKFFLFFVSLISVLMYSATLQRYQIIFSIFLIFVLLYYTTYTINLKSVIIIGLFLIGFFYLISSFRLGELAIYILYKLSKMKFSSEYAIFTEPYMYIAMNLENFANSIQKLEYFTFGYYTFDFFTALTGLKHWIQEYFLLNDNPYFISKSYNTYSAFWTYFRDFGILGIFFIPFLGGLGIGSLYYSFKIKPTIKKLAIYGMFLFATIFSFFNSIVGFLWFFYNFIAIILIFRFVSLSDDNKKLSSNLNLYK